MESHLRERTDEHSQCCVNANEDDVATDRTNVLNYVESDCIAEESSDDELYYVISDYKAAEDNQLDLRQGQEVTVLERVNEKWWWVESEGRVGYSPANHLSLLDQCDDRWQDDEYFSSYSSLKLHLEMLSDKPRTEAYKTAIETAACFIKDKVVLDFGAGTGILSLFCAKLGRARKVYAVEASDIAQQARSIIERNGLREVVSIVQCRGEELELPEKVDLIVSEWMGTMLIFELMIESVLQVRDRYLKPGGLMWPSHAQLLLVPCTAEQVHHEKVAFWDRVYGFDFSPLVPLAQSELLGRPIFNHSLDRQDCLSEPCTVMSLSMGHISVEDLERNESNFSFKITKPGTLHGFGSWFDVTFGGVSSSSGYDPVTLSTSPSNQQTHWKQDLLVIDCPLEVVTGDTIEGRISITRNKIWRRHLKIDVEYKHFSGKAQETSATYNKSFKLWR